MTEVDIINKINKNRDLIERALNLDMDLHLMCDIIIDLKSKNEKLIEELKGKEYE